MPAGRPLKYKTPEEMQEVIDAYFKACQIRKKEMAGIELSEEEKEACEITYDTHPTVSGLALVLDLTRKSLIDYEGKDEFVHTVKRGKARVEAYNEQRLHQPACTGVIFSLKNNFKWQDKSEVGHTGPDGGAIEITDKTMSDVARRMLFVLAAGVKEQEEKDDE